MGRKKLAGLCLGMVLAVEVLTGCGTQDANMETDDKGVALTDVSTQDSLQDTDSIEPQKYTVSHIAMGTLCSSVIYSTGEDLGEDVMALLKEIEEEYISWRVEGSEINRLNESAGQGQIAISEKLAKMLTDTLDISQKSGGALDPTLGKIARLWDIDGENPRVPEEEEITALLSENAYKKIQYEDGKISLADDTLSIDLGAVGKGIGCDEVKAFLQEHSQVSGGVISVGGSIVTYGEKPDGSPWNVAINDPEKSGEDYLGVLALEGEHFVSTSGDYEKYFEQDGVRYHHILDPKTGYPADSGLCSVTVMTENGLLSDGLSTACFVLGLEEGMKLVETYQAEAIFVDKEKQVYCTDGMKELFTLMEGNGYQLVETFN